MKGRIVLFLQTAAVVAAFAGLGWASSRLLQAVRTSPRFNVKSLAVSGVGGPLKRVNEDQIIAQAGFELGSNVFRVDLAAIRQRIERLRWVRYAMVQRVLPDQVIIRVAEREPIGLGRIRGEVYQFDADARILDIDGVSAASFPILDGLRKDDPEGNLRKVGVYRGVIDDIGQTELSEIRINDSAEVSVVSASDPLIVSLGKADFRQRWLKFLQLKTQIQQQYPEAVKVDLRFKNQVIVRMKDDDNSGDQVVWTAEKKTL